MVAHLGPLEVEALVSLVADDVLELEDGVDGQFLGPLLLLLPLLNRVDILRLWRPDRLVIVLQFENVFVVIIRCRIGLWFLA